MDKIIKDRKEFPSVNFYRYLLGNSDKEDGMQPASDGTFMWIVHALDKKIRLYMDGQPHPDTGKCAFGKCVAADISTFTEICRPLSPRLLDFPKDGFCIRIRIRLRQNGASSKEPEGKPSRLEPETVLPIWIVRGQDRCYSLHMREPEYNPDTETYSSDRCFISGMDDFPEFSRLSPLQPGAPPMQAEMLVREAHPLLEKYGFAFETLTSTCPRLEAIYSNQEDDRRNICL